MFGRELRLTSGEVPGVMHDGGGRWGGRLTRRPLPERDDDIERLSDAQRKELVTVWLGRAQSERRVADAFRVIHAALRERTKNAELIALAERAVDDEHRHAELARRVASRFAGQELEPLPPLALSVPEHPDVSEELRHTLHILGHCAMNETFASGFLEATLDLTRASLARAAVQELLADEIDHARIGWAYLAELESEERRELDAHLPSLVAANLRMWREAPRAYPEDPELHRHGAPPAEVAESALVGAIQGLILPGLGHFGLSIGRLQRWVAQGARTDRGSAPRGV